MTRCCFCRDALENHHSNHQHPGGVDRWLCGSCVLYVSTLNHLQACGTAERELARQAAELDAKAVEAETKPTKRSRRKAVSP